MIAILSNQSTLDTFTFQRSLVYLDTQIPPKGLMRPCKNEMGNIYIMYYSSAEAKIDLLDGDLKNSAMWILAENSTDTFPKKELIRYFLAKGKTGPLGLK
jgi:hypothetical protein